MLSSWRVQQPRTLDSLDSNHHTNCTNNSESESSENYISRARHRTGSTSTAVMRTSVSTQSSGMTEGEISNMQNGVTPPQNGFPPDGSSTSTGPTSGTGGQVGVQLVQENVHFPSIPPSTANSAHNFNSIQQQHTAESAAGSRGGPMAAVPPFGTNPMPAPSHHPGLVVSPALSGNSNFPQDGACSNIISGGGGGPPYSATMDAIRGALSNSVSQNGNSFQGVNSSGASTSEALALKDTQLQAMMQEVN